MKPRLSANGAIRMATKKQDRRIQRTRKALLDAFTGLFFERRYDHIKVADIIGRANVGRSTFYEHFTGKEEILTESIRRPFAVLAGAADAEGDVNGLSRVLEHFWQNQSQARLIFVGAARRPVARVLASMIEERLAARARRAAPIVAVPAPLVAVALADALLGAITAWVTAEVECSAATLAESLRRMTQGAIAAIWRSPENGSSVP